MVPESYPSREEVREKLVALIEGRVDRESVSDWAWVYARLDLEPYEECVLDLVDRLTFVEDPPGLGYNLFVVDDFEDWLREFDACCRSDPTAPEPRR